MEIKDVDVAGVPIAEGREEVIAMRMSWSEQGREAFTRLGKEVLSADEVRQFMTDELKSQGNRNRFFRLHWSPLTPEERTAILAEAFDESEYRLPPTE